METELGFAHCVRFGLETAISRTLQTIRFVDQTDDDRSPDPRYDHSDCNKHTRYCLSVGAVARSPVRFGKIGMPSHWRGEAVKAVQVGVVFI